MSRLQVLDGAIGAYRTDRPPARLPVEPQSGYAPSHPDAPAQLRHPPPRGLPHHSRPQSGIAKCVKQCLDDLLAAAAGSPGKQAVHYRPSERKPLDALRRPIRRDLPAAHAPDLLGVGLEEDIEEPRAELVTYPVLERAWIPDRPYSGLHVGEEAARRLDDAELAQCLEGAQRIGVELAVVEDAR